MIVLRVAGQVRAPGAGGGNTMDARVAECAKPGAVCPCVIERQL